MTCSRGHYVPDGTWKHPGPLKCPRCVKEASDQGLREIQVEFLRKIVRGDFGYALVVTKGKAHAQKHAIMFTTKNHAFCGKEFENAPETEKKPYDGETLTALCPLCRSEIAAALEGVAAQ